MKEIMKLSAKWRLKGVLMATHIEGEGGVIAKANKNTVQDKYQVSVEE